MSLLFKPKVLLSQAFLIVFISHTYAHSQMLYILYIERPINLKIFENKKTKGPNQDSQI
jgi:hypothetical protein